MWRPHPGAKSQEPLNNREADRPPPAEDTHRCGTPRRVRRRRMPRGPPTLTTRRGPSPPPLPLPRRLTGPPPRRGGRGGARLPSARCGTEGGAGTASDRLLSASCGSEGGAGEGQRGRGIGTRRGLYEPLHRLRRMAPRSPPPGPCFPRSVRTRTGAASKAAVMRIRGGGGGPECSILNLPSTK